MGPLVQAKLLMPLDAYSQTERLAQPLLAGDPEDEPVHRGRQELRPWQPLRPADDRRGRRRLLQQGEAAELGLELPTTFEEFEAALAKAKAGGETPIQFGNLDKWPGIHEYEESMLQFVTKDAARGFIFAEGSEGFDNEGNRARRRKVQEWARKGYFTDGYAGLGYDPSWQQFGKGNGVFLITGSWLTADLKKALGKDVGFFLLPARPAVARWRRSAARACRGRSARRRENGRRRGRPTSTSSRAPQNAQVLIGAGQLPAMKGKVKVPAGLDTEVYRAWTTANVRDAIVPYLDWATPTMYDTITASVQKLMAGRSTPRQFVDEVQSDYSKFHKGGG